MRCFLMAPPRDAGQAQKLAVDLHQLKRVANRQSAKWGLEATQEVSERGMKTHEIGIRDTFGHYVEECRYGMLADFRLIDRTS